jgi:hypothetical protein
VPALTLAVICAAVDALAEFVNVLSVQLVPFGVPMPSPMPEAGVGLTLVSVRLAVPAAVVKATKLACWRPTVPEKVDVVEPDGLVGDDESFDNKLQPAVSTATATMTNTFMIMIIGAAGGLLQRGRPELLRRAGSRVRMS